MNKTHKSRLKYTKLNMICIKFDQQSNKKPKFWTFEVFKGFLNKKSRPTDRLDDIVWHNRALHSIARKKGMRSCDVISFVCKLNIRK